MKKVELLFYKTNPSKENVGFKHVLLEITSDLGIVNHDWGFAYWNGEGWGEVPTPEGFTCNIFYWANTVNPDLVLNDSKIIKI